MKIVVDSGERQGSHLEVRFLSRDQRATVEPAVLEGEFSGKANSTLYLRDQRILLVGIGDPARLDGGVFRNAAGTAVTVAKKLDQRRLHVDLAAWPRFAGEVVEGIIRGDYRFEQFKARKTAPLSDLRIRVRREDVAATKKDVTRARAIAGGVTLCREVGNQPGNLLYPEVLADRARRLGREQELKVTVLDEKQLQARKFGGILAVGAGSVRAPRLIVIEHRRGPKNQRPIVFVGKAITFDSGGLSIKPAAGMENMFFDKCGGMAVLGAMAAISELGLRRNVLGIIPSAENLPSATAYRPGDVITAYDGTHVEIINTDAEGRIVLADAIAYARKHLNPSAIVDLATLTGACGVALGEHAAGLWSSDDELLKAVQTAAEKSGERLWPMPSYPEYDDQIRSDVAQLKNTGGRLGGACTGAAFLKAFAGDIPWAHLDIAYTAYREKDQAFMARGATGFGVRTLVELAERWS